MATYAIGDVQGCLTPLLRLLEKIHYNDKQDKLLFAGDLINRGKESLETLRFIKRLPNAVCVLGNHDLSLLTASLGYIKPSSETEAILKAEDKVELLHWLAHRPFLYTDPIHHFTLTHAGIYPGWNLMEAQAYAKEVEAALQNNLALFLKNLFGNEPNLWQPSLMGWDRLRFIVNAFTRMRFLTPKGALEMRAKGDLSQHPTLIPWFAFENRATKNDKLLFGHWAALSNITSTENIYPLDSGCVWGFCLTAFCLETQQRITISCDEYVKSP